MGKGSLSVTLGCLIALALFCFPGAAGAVEAVPTPLPAQPGFEQEPNGAPGTATPLGSGQRMRAALSPAGESDYYRFEARAGDRVFASTMTSAVGSTGATQLALLAADGATTLELDLDDGSSGSSASSIAGAAIPSNGTYYLKVSHPSTEGVLRLYDLYLQLHSGLPLPEMEPNDSPAEAAPLSGGYVSGRQSPSSDRDFFALNLNAGDTVFLSLDLDPERDGISFNARLGVGLFHEDKHIAVVNNRVTAFPSIPAEDYKVTVSRSGTYYAYIKAVGEDEGGEEATYRLSATVLPADQPSCRTYVSRPSPGAISDDGERIFPISVSDPGLIERAAISLDMTHNFPRDLVASLHAPSGYEVPLFDDIGSFTPGLHVHWLAHFEPYAAVSPLGTLNPVMVQPEIGDQLAWLVGQQMAGTWSLVVRDEALGETGSVAAIELILCSPSPLSTSTALIPAVSPLLSRLKVTPRRFRAANSATAASHGRAGGKAAIGATVSYWNSQQALARLSLLKSLPGRRVRGRCVAFSSSTADEPRCRRLQDMGGFAHRDLAGKNSMWFSGRVMGRKLPPGRYLLSVSAVAPTDMQSNRLRRSFVVLP